MLKLRLLLALSLCCVSLAGYAIAEKEQGYINVSSSITKDVDPDKAEVVFYVETSEKTAQEAADKNKTITNNVIDAIKPEIIANEKDSIKTSAFIVRPDYYWTKDNKKVLNSYIATNSVYVITTNIQNAGKIIDLALQAGATKVDSFRLTLDNDNNYCTGILEDAAKDTMFKAGSIAKVLGTSVAGVKSINTSCNTQNSNPTPYRLMAKNAVTESADSVAGISSTPIEAGKIKVYANVNASYFLK